MNKADYQAKAKELGLSFTEENTVAELKAMIAEASGDSDIRTKATALGIEFDEDTSDELLSLQVQLKEQEKLNDDLQTELENEKTANRNSNKLPVIDYKGEQYQIMSKRFVHVSREIGKKKAKDDKVLRRTGKSTIYSAEGLAKNKELQAELIEAGSNHLIKVSDLEKREADRKKGVADNISAFNAQKDTM